MRFAAALWVAVLAGLMTGCSTTSTRQLGPKVDLTHYRHVYVQSASNDNAQLDVLLASALTQLGFDASSGVRTMRPDNAELVLTYDTRWEWDFHQYLIELTVTVSDARSERLITAAREFHPGITKRSPAEMARDVVAQLFGPPPK